MTQRLTLNNVQMMDEYIAVNGTSCRKFRGHGPNGEEVFLLVAQVLVPTPEAQRLFQTANAVDPKKLN